MSIDNHQYQIYSVSNLEYPYVMTYNYINSIIQGVINGTINTWFQSDFFQETSDYIVKYFMLPVDYLKFYPNEPTNRKTVTSIRLGKVSVNLDGYALIKAIPPLKLFEYDMTRYYNNFLDYPPYTKIKLYVPFFEEIELDGQVLYGTKLIAYVAVDFTSGHSTLYLYADTILIDVKTANIAIEMPVGRSNAEEQQRNRNLIKMQFLGDLIVGGVQAGTGQYIKSGLTMAQSTLSIAEKTAQNNVRRMTGYKGSSGTRDTLAVDKTVKLIFERPTNIKYPDYAVVGKPTEELFSSLVGMTGYIKVGQINFNYDNQAIYTDEVDEIVSLLQSGVIL